MAGKQGKEQISGQSRFLKPGPYVGLGGVRRRRGRFTFARTPHMRRRAEQIGNLSRLVFLGREALRGKTVKQLRKEGHLPVPLPGFEQDK